MRGACALPLRGLQFFSLFAQVICNVYELGDQLLIMPYPQHGFSGVDVAVLDPSPRCQSRGHANEMIPCMPMMIHDNG